MADTGKVIIIGGGINGAAIAFHLAAAGAAVTLLEKSAIASGPTGRSCGIVRQHYSHRVTASMALRALEIFRNFDDVVGGECDFRETGFLLAARPDNVESIRANVELQRSVGIDTRMITLEEMKELQPDVVTDGFAAGVWEAGAGYADAHATTTSYARRAADLGADIRTGVRVHSILAEQGRALGVACSDGPLLADAVVLAAGPWSPALARVCGVQLPITPSRVQVCLFDPAPGIVPRSIFVDSAFGTYLRPESGPKFLVGSIETVEGEGNVTDPDNYDQSPDLARIEHYSERLMARVPAMREGRYHNGWASLYDVTPDWQPIIDAVLGIDGLYCVAGSSGHGFKLAPVVSEMATRLILEGRQPDDDLDMFAFSRFAQENLTAGSYPDHKILG